MLSHPIVEKTLILFPSVLVDNKFVSNLVFVDTENFPFTVSGAKTIFQTFSPSASPSYDTLSTTAEANPYSSDGC